MKISSSFNRFYIGIVLYMYLYFKFREKRCCHGHQRNTFEVVSPLVWKVRKVADEIWAPLKSFSDIILYQKSLVNNSFKL